jgi:hypothetical protein
VTPPRRAFGACLHIGLPKTGTTLLQSRLFPRHPEIGYLGKHLGEGGAVRGGPAPARLIGQVLRRPFGDWDPRRARARFDAEVAPLRDRGRLLLWSSEDLTVGSRARRRARAERLFALLGPSRVLLTVRHPVHLMESLYLQLVRAQVVGRSARLGRRWAVPTPEAWLEAHAARPEGGALGHLDYAETLRIFEGVFGPDSVRVLVFEELVNTPRVFIRALCSHLQIEAADAIAATEGARRNDRWTQTQFDRLVALHVSRLGRGAVRFSPVGLRRWYFAGLSTEGPRARARLPASWRARIAEQTAAGHRWIADTWNLPLASLGYPL